MALAFFFDLHCRYLEFTVRLPINQRGQKKKEKAPELTQRSYQHGEPWPAWSLERSRLL
jgi:hypothetical protein